MESGPCKVVRPNRSGNLLNILDFQRINTETEAFGPKVTENIPGTPTEPDYSQMSEKRNLDNLSNQLTTIVNEMAERRLSIDRIKLTTPVKELTMAKNHSSSTNHSTNQMLSSYADSSQGTSTSDLEVDFRRKSKQDKEGVDPETLMFRDGRRKIDMVVSYEEESEGVMTELESKRRKIRKVFLENLVKEGLELEVEDKSQTYDEKTCFVKIHVPRKTETRYSDVLNLKLPIKRFITISVKACFIALVVL